MRSFRLILVLGACATIAACGAAGHPVASKSRVRSSGAAATATASISPAAATRPAAPPTPVLPAAPAVYGYGNAPVPAAAEPVSTASPDHVIGTGTPASCTSAAVVQAVAEGGIITFSCGPGAVTITMTATAKVVNTHALTVIDGGGKVTLSGGGQVRILYMNTCDQQQVLTTTDCWRQQYPQVVVQNLTFTDAYDATQQIGNASYGGGAIFASGGQLTVVNSGFFRNACYAVGPDLGGAAIRALGMYQGVPVNLSHDTFQDGRCSNGGALSSIDASWDVVDCMFGANQAIGSGGNPALGGAPGGGSGGAIYTDGENYDVTIDDSLIQNSSARTGGGAIFFVVDGGPGTLTIENGSVLRNNPSGQFQNAPGIFDSVDGHDVSPVVTDDSFVG